MCRRPRPRATEHVVTGQLAGIAGRPVQAGVVDQHVDGTLMLLDVGGHGSDGVAVGDIDRHEPGLRREELAELAGVSVSAHREDRKIVEHPSAGSVTVDCDVLTDGDTELKIVILTAAPGTEDETRLHLAAAAAGKGR